MFEKVVVLGDSAQHPRRHPKKENKPSAPDPSNLHYQSSLHIFAGK